MNWELIGGAVGVVGLVYGFLRNFKSDINERFDRIDGKFDKIEDKFDKIENRFDKIEDRFDRIESEIKEIRTGLNRMEGAFYSKDCCMLKESKSTGTEK